LPGEQTSPIARIQRERDGLAKAWLVELIERTPLEEIEGIEVGLLAREAPRLIADILRALADADLARVAGVDPSRAARGVGVRGLRRRGEDAASLPRDLAALHALLIAALRDNLDPEDTAELAAAARRLAEIFGGIQATLTAELAREWEGEAGRDRLTGLPGSSELDQWMRMMIAAERRYGTPFSVLLVDIDGLSRINDAYGRRAGDRMLAAVAGVVSRQVRAADRAFRLPDDELCVLLPYQGPIPALPVASRLVALVEGAQGSDGPRVDIAVGIAACPEHGRDAETLLARAEEASYAAKASGESVAIADGARPAWLQDR
jgi:diguanylate cyclase (GGDEF)-like protein